MKLGMWNRLAIVGAVLAVLILPAWLVIDTNMRFAKDHEEGFTQCIEAASKPNDGTLTYNTCREIWPVDGQYQYGWEEWQQAALATLIAYAVLYGLVWIFVWTAGWVLQGRQSDV